MSVGESDSCNRHSGLNSVQISVYFNKNTSRSVVSKLLQCNDILLKSLRPCYMGPDIRKCTFRHVCLVKSDRGCVG